MNNLKGIITNGGYTFLIFVNVVFTKEFKLFLYKSLFRLENFYNWLVLKFLFHA